LLAQRATFLPPPPPHSRASPRPGGNRASVREKPPTSRRMAPVAPFRRSLRSAVTSGPLQQRTDSGLIARRETSRAAERARLAVRGPELTAERIGRASIREVGDGGPSRGRSLPPARQRLGRWGRRARFPDDAGDMPWPPGSPRRPAPGFPPTGFSGTEGLASSVQGSPASMGGRVFMEHLLCFLNPHCDGSTEAEDQGRVCTQTRNSVSLRPDHTVPPRRATHPPASTT
jgi:hypothetical protein